MWKLRPREAMSKATLQETVELAFKPPDYLTLKTITPTIIILLGVKTILISVKNCIL